MLSKYIVFYVDNSSPKIKAFKNLKEAKIFANKFKTDLYSGYWVDYIVKGKFIKIYDGLHVPKKLINNKKNNYEK